jgi:3-deoxy-D-manno-octulosonate 8-phosphate phosphatase (KDO 8-P phosphatase)
MSERTTIPADIASSIRLVILDVDGVMTGGGVYLGETRSGEAIEFKRFEITDGLGIRLLKQAGVEVAIVTGRRSRVVAMRARELGIAEVHQDPQAAKLRVVQRLLERRGLGWAQTACLGDDLADLPVLRRVALPVAVANAVPEVAALARWRTSRAGGSGAVREFAEALLKARGAWESVVAAYLGERGDGVDGAP